MKEGETLQESVFGRLIQEPEVQLRFLSWHVSQESIADRNPKTVSF